MLWVQKLPEAEVSKWVDLSGIESASLGGQEMVDAIDGCRALILMASAWLETCLLREGRRAAPVLEIRHLAPSILLPGPLPPSPTSWVPGSGEPLPV